MDMEKMIQGKNWDGSEISVKIKNLPEWTKWDIYNRKRQIHPTQKVFTEADFLPKSLHLSQVDPVDVSIENKSKTRELI